VLLTGQAKYGSARLRQSCASCCRCVCVILYFCWHFYVPSCDGHEL